MKSEIMDNDFNQCNQIEQFSKDFGDLIVHLSCPNIIDFLGYF